MMDMTEWIQKLSDYKRRLNSRLEFDEAAEELKKQDLVSLANYIIYTNDLDVGKDETIKLLVECVNTVYTTTGDDVLPDAIYDTLYAKYKELYGEVNTSDKSRVLYNHKYPELRGTIEKIHFITKAERGNDDKLSLEDWIEKKERALKGTPLAGKVRNSLMLLTLKIDGISGIAECDEYGKSERVLKRGDVTRNEAHNMKVLENISFEEYEPGESGVPFGVKMEVAMTQIAFEEFKRNYGDFSSPRSAVTSIVNSDDPNPEHLNYLRLIPLQAKYPDDEFEEVVVDSQFFMYANLSDLDGVRNAIKKLEEVSYELGIPADGVVMRFNNKEIMRQLGRDDSVNMYEVAYKFPPVRKVTKLRDIEFSLGALGGLSAMAKIVPVVMKGNTIRSISLGSIGRMKNLELRRDQDVVIYYDVIPYLTVEPDCEIGSGEIIQLPTCCPECGADFTIENEEMSCTNFECPSVKKGLLLNFISKVKIPDIAISTVSDFYDLGYLTDIPSLYDLHKYKESLYNLKGYGRKSIDGILKSIDSRKTLYDYELLGSFGINSVGRKKFEMIFAGCDMSGFIDMVENRTLDKLMSIKGVGGSTVSKIAEALAPEFRGKEFGRLLTKVKVKRKEFNPDSLSILFTKVRDSDFEDHLTNLGHAVVDSYNKDVKLVIVPTEDTTSGKVEKARKNGTAVITIEAAKKMFNYTK